VRGLVLNINDDAHGLSPLIIADVNQEYRYLADLRYNFHPVLAPKLQLGGDGPWGVPCRV
jgi:hypothetical protein